MSEAINCKRCGKLFTYIAGQPLCSTCRKEEEKQFKMVKEYLYVNPGATITEIANELDISIKKIKYYLREGRLEIVGDEGNMMLECEKCGKAIKSGRYCDICQNELALQLRGAASKITEHMNKKDKEFGMRYLHKDDKGKQ